MYIKKKVVENFYNVLKVVVERKDGRK